VPKEYDPKYFENPEGRDSYKDIYDKDSEHKMNVSEFISPQKNIKNSISLENFTETEIKDILSENNDILFSKKRNLKDVEEESMLALITQSNKVT
jgi:hypothetical protein